MGTIELKSHLHKIVDEIQSEQLLQTLYDFLQSRKDEKNGSLWNSLSESQKSEIILSYNESENESNLVEATKIFKNFK